MLPIFVKDLSEVVWLFPGTGSLNNDFTGNGLSSDYAPTLRYDYIETPGIKINKSRTDNFQVE